MMLGNDKNVDMWSLGITLYFMLFFDPEKHTSYNEENLPWFVKNGVGLYEKIK
jgi:serine/threonine protein kinase